MALKDWLIHCHRITAEFDLKTQITHNILLTRLSNHKTIICSLFTAFCDLLDEPKNIKQSLVIILLKALTLQHLNLC